MPQGQSSPLWPQSAAAWPLVPRSRTLERLTLGGPSDLFALYSIPHNSQPALGVSRLAATAARLERVPRGFGPATEVYLETRKVPPPLLLCDSDSSPSYSDNYSHRVHTHSHCVALCTAELMVGSAPKSLTADPTMVPTDRQACIGAHTTAAGPIKLMAGKVTVSADSSCSTSAVMASHPALSWQSSSSGMAIVQRWHGQRWHSNRPALAWQSSSAGMASHPALA